MDASSCEGDLGEISVEGRTLDLGDLKLESRRLASTARRRDGASAPGRSSVDLIGVRELSAGLGVAKGDVNHAMVSEGGDAGKGGGLLSSAEGGGRNEDACVLASEGA